MGGNIAIRWRSRPAAKLIPCARLANFPKRKRPPCWTRAHAPPPSTFRTTSPRTGCRSPPTGPSRRRRDCSPAPRTCITLPSTAARSSMPHRACGAPMPVMAAARFPRRSPSRPKLWITPRRSSSAFPRPSNSEAADTALKIALAYHQIQGQGTRTRLIGRERGYHGVGFGGTSVGGIVNNRKMFGTLLAGVDHLPHTYDRDKQAFSKGEPEYGAHFADELERLVNLHGASTIAAVIVEPMAGSTGVLPAPKGYLK